MIHTSKFLSLSLAAACSAAFLLSGCTTTQGPQPSQAKASYQEFSDVTWLPETDIRSPYRTAEIPVPTEQALKDGIYAFFDTNRSLFKLETNPDGSLKAREIVEKGCERALTWGKGTSILYRDSKPVENSGEVTAVVMDDGRVLLQNEGKAPFNIAIQLRAFDIAGKPIRQFLRNSNNQPDELAWFIPDSAVFPAGSIAYIGIYWLGDDEILRPSMSAFTGAQTLDRLVRRYTRTTPFCLSYINHQSANPYGVVFNEKIKQSRRKKAVVEGEFSLLPVKQGSMFCEPLDTQPQAKGTWKIKRIQGNRVLELIPDAEVNSSDLGVQPINKESVGVGFAEVMVSSSKGQRLNAVPVRILRNNMPIVDFRLKFNTPAANAVSAVLQDAERSRADHEALYGARNQLSRSGSDGKAK